MEVGSNLKAPRTGWRVPFELRLIYATNQLIAGPPRACSALHNEGGPTGGLDTGWERRDFSVAERRGVCLKGFICAIDNDTI